MTEDKRHLRPGADGICGVAFLFCDQKRNQKSLGGKIKSVPPINARGTRATNFGTIAARLFLHGIAAQAKSPLPGGQPPAPPKRLKILDFTPKATTGRLLGRNPKFLFG